MSRNVINANRRKIGLPEIPEGHSICPRCKLLLRDDAPSEVEVLHHRLGLSKRAHVGCVWAQGSEYAPADVWVLAPAIVRPDTTDIKCEWTYFSRWQILLAILRMKLGLQARRVIKDPETGEPYLIRWNWRPCRWFAIKLHHILREDYGRDLHDHPWWFVSIVLKGWYVEQVPQRFAVTSATGGSPYSARDNICIMGWNVPRFVRWFNFKRATGKHRIIEVSPGGAWTLVINGPRIREWGFHTARGFVPWWKYLP